MSLSKLSVSVMALLTLTVIVLAAFSYVQCPRFDRCAVTLLLCNMQWKCSDKNGVRNWRPCEVQWTRRGRSSVKSWLLSE